MITVSSGETGLTTSGDGYQALLTIPSGQYYHRLIIINEGAAPGFYSFDNGGTSHRLPVGTISLHGMFTGTIKFKRVNSGTDMSGVFASAL